MKVIAICGGIGTGKSVVSRIVSAMGFEVYDCDREAKILMDSSPEIKAALAEAFSEAIFTQDGKPDRELLAAIVFADAAKLARLNEIVHAGVRHHLQAWLRQQHEAEAKTAFFETAIPYTSHIDTYADEIWAVTAPESLRIQRVIARNNTTPEAVMARIKAQTAELDQLRDDTKAIAIINDCITPLLPQIERMLQKG